MLKKMINSAHIALDILPVDPMLIKSGQATVGGVNMSFVRTYRFGEREEPYIPGSSLKGVIRSYAEKICRSLRETPVPVCLPYLEPRDIHEGEERQASCGLCLEKFKKDHDIKTIPSTKVYWLSCPACRLFGSHGFTGRFATSDAYLTDSFKASGSALLEIRDGVAIDRLTGGTAGGAKYDLEVLTRGEFGTILEIRNFERWQIGLIGLVLRDMEQGLVRIGYGKSRGLGRFRAKINNFQISYYNQEVERLSGLAALCSEAECSSYGFFAETTNDVSPLPEPRANGLRREYTITDTWKEALTPAVNDLVAYIGEVDWPQCLERFLERRE